MHSIRLQTVRRLILKLPKPDATYSRAGVDLDVYQAKQMFSPYWRNPATKALVAIARASYSRYGLRPSFDDFDNKAVIYLIRCRYEVEGVATEEWYSVRLVPGEGEPLGGGELEMYSFQDKPLVEQVGRKLGYPVNQPEVFWKRFISSSRMCGIHPFTTYPQPRSRPLELDQKHRFTAVCFSLAHTQFIYDYPKYQKGRWITAIIRGELLEKGLGVEQAGKNYYPLFIPARRTLGIPLGEDVELHSFGYALEFPSYWLHKKQLMGVLDRLIGEGRLDRGTVQHYLGCSHTCRLGFRRLGALLTAEGKLNGSPVTGDELRLLVHQEVACVPELKITPIRYWNGAVQKVVEVAGIK